MLVTRGHENPNSLSRTGGTLVRIMDAIAQHAEPTQTQLDALEKAYLSTGEYLITSDELSGKLIEIHAQGSREIGTMVRPRDKSREGFDIDLVARIGEDKQQFYAGINGAKKLLDDIYLPMARYAEQHSLSIKRWDRCVTLTYAGGMSADITPIIDSPLLTGTYGATHGLIPSRKSETFDSSNPRGFAKCFNKIAAIQPNFTHIASFSKATEAFDGATIVELPDSQKVFERLLSRIVQVIKIHRNIAFGTSAQQIDYAPKSIFLTTLAAAAYEDLARQPHRTPIDLLWSMVKKMPSYIKRSSLHNGAEEWYLPNPAVLHENLASGMNSTELQTAFTKWHQKLNHDLEKIEHLIKSSQGLDALIAFISNAFGERAATDVRLSLLNEKKADKLDQKTFIYATSGASLVLKSQPNKFYGN